MGKSPDAWSPGSKALFVRDGVLGFDTGWIGDVNGSVTANNNAGQIESDERSSGTLMFNTDERWLEAGESVDRMARLQNRIRC